MKSLWQLSICTDYRSRTENSRPRLNCPGAGILASTPAVPIQELSFSDGASPGRTEDTIKQCAIPLFIERSVY
jgi:hypothetical protein